MDNHTYLVPNIVDRYQRNGLIAGIIGFVLLILGLFVSGTEQFFRAYYLGYMVFLSLAFGSLGLLLLQFLTGGAWGVLIRRMLEAGTRLLPIAALLYLPILFGMHAVYPWSYSNAISQVPEVVNKSGYLSEPFFLVRILLYFIIFTVIAAGANNYSKKQDEQGGAFWDRKLENWSGGGLLFFFLIMTFVSTDLIMSLSPEWYSTMLVFIVVVGEAISVLTMCIIMVILLSQVEPMASLVKKVHLHDLGKLLFAFNFLWGYLTFCQYLITYSGNLPEEIFWYRSRALGGWEWVAYAVIFVHFILPFILLLSRDLKRNGRTLTMVAGLLFIMRIVDMYWLVEPNWHRGEFFLSWTDIVAPLGFVGLFVYLFVWQYKKRPMMPIHESEMQFVLHPKGAH